MARGRWLERNEGARVAVKKDTADYKAQWAKEKEARAADRGRVMCGE